MMFLRVLSIISLILLPLMAQIDYSKVPRARAFAKEMSKRYGFSESYILNLFKRVKHQSQTLARYQGRVKVGYTDFSWSRYKSKILSKESILLGKKFMKQNSKWLKLASKRFRVSPEIIASFIRVESKFCRYGNEYPVLDSLVTLAFNPNRKQKFFKSELKSLFILTRKNHLNPLKLRGSFAGAMGCVQQVPSIQLQFGIDLDRDGKINPNSVADSIGSIANFLHKNRWSNSRPIVVRAKVKGSKFRYLRSSYRLLYPLTKLKRYGITPVSYFPYKKAYFIRLKDARGYDIFLGDRDYRIITLYNASKRYATAVALYAKALKR